MFRNHFYSVGIGIISASPHQMSLRFVYCGRCYEGIYDCYSSARSLIVAFGHRYFFDILKALAAYFVAVFIVLV